MPRSKKPQIPPTPAKNKQVPVEPGIYLRHTGKLVVPVWDPVKGGRTYTHPDVPKGGFPGTEEGLKAARAFKERVEAEKAERARTGTAQAMCDQYAKAWPKTHPRPEESSNRVMGRNVRQFARDFEGVPMSWVSRRMARLYIHGGPVPADASPRFRAIVEGWKGTQVVEGQMVAVPHSGYKWIRAMWNDAANDEVVPRNPFAALGVSNGRGRADVVMLTGDELDQLVACAEKEWGDFGGRMIGPAIRVAAGTGMRPGELFASRWPWIDWEEDELHVKRQLDSVTREEKLPGKERRARRKTRRIPLIPMVRAALQVLREGRRTDTDLVLYTQTGVQFDQRSWWYYWDPVRRRFWKQLPASRREDIDPGFDFYELRHYFGSYLGALRGPGGEVLVSPQDIAEMLGHKDGGKLAMELYIHTDSDAARGRVKAAVLASQQRQGAAESG